MKSLELKTKILIIIASLLFILCIFFSVDLKKETAITSEIIPKNLLENFSVLKIFFNDDNKITIKKIGEEFYLLNKINNEVYSIKKNKIENIIISFTTKNKMTLVSKNKFTKLKNEINFILEAENGEIVLEVFLGDCDTLGLNRFIKFSNGNVYKATDIYTETIKVQTADWIERQLFKNVLQNTNVQMISIDDKTQTKNTANRKDFESFDAALSSFQVLNIFSLPITEVKKTFTNKPKTLKITLGDTKTFTLKFTQMNSGDYLVFSELHNAHYIASNYAVEKLFDKVFIILR